jgi:hypothetical protein
MKIIINDILGAAANIAKSNLADMDVDPLRVDDADPNVPGLTFGDESLG